MINIPPVPLVEVLKKDSFIDGAEPEPRQKRIPTIYDCICIVCNAEWTQKIVKDQKPSGRCPRCGNDQFGYSTHLD